jgi:hypothetical protein
MVAMVIGLPVNEKLIFWSELPGKQLGVHSTGTTATGAGTASDGGHDGEAVVFVHWGAFLAQIADIFVIQVNVHEGSQFALISIQVTSQIRVRRGQRGKRLAHVIGLHVNTRLLARILS